MTSTVSSCSQRCGPPAVGHEVVDQHAEPSARYGAGLGDPAGQVVLPHPLRQLGVVDAPHLQQAVPRGAGGVAGDADRAGRGHLGLLRSRPGSATTSGTARRFRLRDSTSAP